MRWGERTHLQRGLCVLDPAPPVTKDTPTLSGADESLQAWGLGPGKSLPPGSANHSRGEHVAAGADGAESCLESVPPE